MISRAAITVMTTPWPSRRSPSGIGPDPPRRGDRLERGTTNTALAQLLSTREDLNAPSNRPTLTVVTNAINIASQLAVRPNIKIMVTGAS